MARDAGAEDATILPDLLLDRYRVEERLGEGGLGIVVKAFDTRLKRVVAIKTLKRALATTEPAHYRALEDRFSREAEAGSRVGDHPNLVTVYDLVMDAERTQYLICQYVPGGTLAERIAAGPLPRADALRLTVDVARGLQAAHEAGIVHRDIKPSNVFLAADGHAQVGDFGIAQMDHLSNRTHALMSHPGTPLYMSPEQAQTTGYVRPDTDQYSLGLVLFEMLTGKAYKRLRERQVETLLAEQPPVLAALIRQMTAPRPDDRYDDLAAIIALIADIPQPLSSPDIPSEYNAAIEPAPQLKRAEDTPRLADVTVREERPQNTLPHHPTPPAPPVQPLKTATANGSVAADVRPESQVFTPVLTSSTTVLAEEPVNIPTEYTDYVQRPLVDNRGRWRRIKILTGHTDYVQSVDFSPDGQTLATGSWDRTVRLWRVTDGVLLQNLSAHTNSVFSVAFAPGNDLVASGSSDTTVQLWNPIAGKVLYKFAKHRNPITGIAFSPNGQVLATASWDNTVGLWHFADDAFRITRGPTDRVLSVAFSPDGQFLSAGSADTTVWLWRASDRTFVRRLTGHTYPVTCVTFSPDGETIATASLDATVRLWNVSDGKLITCLTGHRRGIHSVAFSPNGEILATGSRDATMRLWDISGGESLHTFSGHKGTIASVAFSPNGQILASASADKTTRLWSIE